MNSSLGSYASRRCIAPVSAEPQRAGRAALTTSSVSALAAGHSSLPTGTAVRNAVAVHVLSACAETARQPVYNLTVEDTPEYIANGVLVHNCDALRYMVAYADNLALDGVQPDQILTFDDDDDRDYVISPY